MTPARTSGSPRAPTTAALGGLFLAAGLAFNLISALVAGAGLLVLVVGSVGWVELASLRGRLERGAAPGRIEEGDPYRLQIRLRGTLLPPPGGELTDPLLERPVAVGPRWSRALSRQVWLDGPGPRRLEPATLVVRDPLRLWERKLRSAGVERLVVLPRVDPVRRNGTGGAPAERADGGRPAAGQASGRGGIAQFEVDGLRPYREGSPASRIHWPAVARTGEMIERRLIAGGEPRPLIVLELRGAAESSARDRAMRAAASLCVTLARSGGCELLLPGERRPLAIDPALRSWPEAHTRIALADRSAPASPSAALRAGVVLWVTASGAVPPAARRLPAGSLLIGARGSRSSAAFRVAGCVAHPLAAPKRPARRRRAA